MSKVIKIQKPKFVEELEEIKDVNNEIILSDRIQNRIVENIVVKDKNDTGTSIDSCIFKNVIFDNCTLKNIDLIDTRFENCDLSNVDLSGGTLYRIEFVNCKLVGTKFDECGLRDVLFKEVCAKYSNFSFTRLKGVNMLESDFNGSVFQEVRREKVAFNEIDFSNSYFNKTTLSKLDLTSCNITDIDIEIRDLAGAIVTPMQALDLTRLMDLTIK